MLGERDSGLEICRVASVVKAAANATDKSGAAADAPDIETSTAANVAAGHIFRNTGILFIMSDILLGDLLR